jgi:flagellar hook-associated protein 1 FlgK
VNEIRIPANEISSTTGALTINGTEIVNKIPADDTFNLSIDEREFFEVQQADGSFVYTSDGEFKVSANRQLVDNSDRVLQPPISLPENAVSFWIDIDGKVNAELANGEVIENIDTIKTVVFPKPGKLESLGENLFNATAASGAPDENMTTGTVLSSIGDLTALVNNINAERDSTLGVEARLDFDGSLILSNAQGSEAQTISLGTGSGVFTGISGNIQSSINITATRSAGDTSARSVALTLGQTGSAADLAKIGFAATLTVADTLSEDLIVFTTGSVGNAAALSTSFEKGTADPLQLRSSPFQINFTSDSVYQIKDTTTNTVLAQRTYVAGQPIEYQNLQVILDGAPKSGDVFSVDDNGDGFGSNENLLRLIDLESAKVLGNNDTLHESYLGLLNQAGSTARQAQVTQQALQVAYEQANTARDKVAGVKLDEEAANLIRFQQSYQASARLIQTANQLFDQILRL